jgi:putative membrane protein
VSLVAGILCALVALEHLYFLVLEMFLWTRPAGRRAFGLSAEDAERTRTLAANQGLYNGFLAAGLVWSLFAPEWLALRLFFLCCVIVAGVFGAATVGRKILFIQALPAALALVAGLASR